MYTTCREVIATFSHKKRDTAVELRFDENSPQIVIDADKNRIVQVLSNFLTNALKFTTKGSITLSYSLEDESQVRFCVTDTGKGIPDEQKHEIFNRFVKLDSFVQGAGLGLSICQSLVNRMGGKIGVESREGKGRASGSLIRMFPVLNQKKRLHIEANYVYCSAKYGTNKKQ